MEARPNADHGLFRQVDGAGDLPGAFAQGRLQAAQNVQVSIRQIKRPFALQGVEQALQVAARVVQVRLFHLDIEEANRGVQLYVQSLDRLAHHLAVDLAFGRHVDDAVAVNLGAAAKAAPLGQRPLLGVTFLDGGKGGQAVCIAHLAPAANAAPAAHRIEINPQRPRGRQHRRAHTEAPPATGRGEDDSGLGGVGHGALFISRCA